MSIPPEKSQPNFKPWVPVEKTITKNQVIKSLAWIVGGIIVGVIIGMEFEVIFEVAEEGVILVLEFLEEMLDIFYERVLKLGPTIAPIATAYTGFVFALVMVYFLVRKGIKLYKHLSEVLSAWKEAYINAFNLWWNDWRGIALRWWDQQNLINKITTVVAIILIGIPLALLFSVFLGSIVAAFL